MSQFFKKKRFSCSTLLDAFNSIEKVQEYISQNLCNQHLRYEYSNAYCVRQIRIKAPAISISILACVII